MQESPNSRYPVTKESIQSPGSKRAAARALKVALALIVAAIVVVPFFYAHRQTGPDGDLAPLPISTHDMAQHIAVMQQFDLVIRTGTIYPRWQPDFNHGYGLAWTNFYQPGFFYLTTVFNALIGNWMSTLLVITILSLAASGLAFYLLSRQFYDRWASAIAALLYMLLPYHTLDLYWRAALPELQGFIFVPLAVYFAFKVGEFGKPRHYAGLGLTYGLYLLTHFPVSYLFTYTLALYGLVWALRARDWRIALRLAAGMSIGLMLGAVYLVPAALEYKHIDEHFTTIFPYHNSYVTLLPGGDRFADLINESFAGQAVVLAVAVTVLFAVPAARTGLSKDYQTRLWVILGIGTTFMCTSLSIYISKLIPKITSVSFAWRWMVITSFFSVLLFSAAIDRLRAHAGLANWRKLAFSAALGAAIMLNLWITAQGVIKSAFSNPALSIPANHIEEAFIPKGGTSPRNLPDTPLATLRPEGGAAEILRWEPLYREIGVNAPTPCALRLKTYNFRGWVARVDGQDAPIASDKDGAQLIALDPGVHTIEVFFVSTPPRTFGSVLSVLALIIITGMTVFDFIRRRKRRAERPVLSVNATAKSERDASPGRPAW